jgi:cyclic pyranopterin phosphate synthase
MPSEGVQLMKHSEILSFEEIKEVVKVAVGMGITKIRLTGGEPLVRKDIVVLVKMIAEIEGIEDIALTTNGILLKKLAIPLKNAGLKRVNISLDSINPKKFRDISGGGEVNKVFEGIQAAIEAGLRPIKLNCVVFKSSNEKDALEVKEFANKHNLEVRFIRQMNLKTGEFSIVEGGIGGNCKQCNRLRLTANGMVKPCLFDEYEFSVRKLGAKQALISALNAKPLNGCYNRTGSFYGIGG